MRGKQRVSVIDSVFIVVVIRLYETLTLLKVRDINSPSSQRCNCLLRYRIR